MIFVNDILWSSTTFFRFWIYSGMSGSPQSIRARSRPVPMMLRWICFGYQNCWNLINKHLLGIRALQCEVARIAAQQSGDTLRKLRNFWYDAHHLAHSRSPTNINRVVFGCGHESATNIMKVISRRCCIIEMIYQSSRAWVSFGDSKERATGEEAQVKQFEVQVNPHLSICGNLALSVTAFGGGS